jgi:hypothetical protein
MMTVSPEAHPLVTERQPLITVAMVTYNSSAYMKLAIDSVLCSSYPHFELLISDDNSTDNTWEIISSYADPRIRAIRNEKNLGEYPNRDQCVRLARGEYLIFIDGDDIVYPHGLEFMIRMLGAFPDCGMALMYPFDQRIIFPVVISSRDYYLNFYFGRGLLDVAFTNTLFRTAALRKIGGIAVRYNSGDDYTRLQVATISDTLIICDQLTWWRISPDQASQRMRSNPCLSMKEMIDMSHSVLDLPSCPLTAEEKLSVRKNIGFRLKMQLLQCCRRLRLRQAWGLSLLAGKIPLSFGRMMATRQDTNLDPFKKYSGTNPYKMDFSANPYSNLVKNNRE